MNKLLERYLKKDELGYLQILSEEALVYIPSRFFNENMAEFAGDYVNTLASIIIEFKNGTSISQPFSLNTPVKLKIMFREFFKVTKEFKNSELQEYTVLVLDKGSRLTETNKNIQSLENIIAFFAFFNACKLDPSIPNIDIPRIYKDSAKLNGMNLGVPSFLVELMISELLRDKNDINIPFRHISGKTGTTNGYNFVGIKELAENSSVFSAIAFENINKAMLTSVRKTRNKELQYTSPIEKILYY